MITLAQVGWVFCFLFVCWFLFVCLFFTFPLPTDGNQRPASGILLTNPSPSSTEPCRDHLLSSSHLISLLLHLNLLFSYSWWCLVESWEEYLVPHTLCLSQLQCDQGRTLYWQGTVLAVLKEHALHSSPGITEKKQLLRNWKYEDSYSLSNSGWVKVWY